MKLYAILMLVIIEMARIDSDRLALLPLGPLGDLGEESLAR
jgi:hypothetical protein